MGWFKKPEPEVTLVEKRVEVVKHVPVGDGVKDIFIARSVDYEDDFDSYLQRYKWWMQEKSFREMYDYTEKNISPEPQQPTPPSWHGHAFALAEEAFAAAGAGKVSLTKIKAFVHEGIAYTIDRALPLISPTQQALAAEH